MSENYFIKPQTIDRIRADWLGEAIERYVAWLITAVVGLANGVQRSLRPLPKQGNEVLVSVFLTGRNARECYAPVPAN